mmetsp:Transcript_17773/g.50301  ORF Transcript_17773/g.50301 Transcript_17773/m.50301 type:complete len:213 (-) Transcript_17773:246-884(-)
MLRKQHAERNAAMLVRIHASSVRSLARSVDRREKRSRFATASSTSAIPVLVRTVSERRSLGLSPCSAKASPSSSCASGSEELHGALRASSGWLSATASSGAGSSASSPTASSIGAVRQRWKDDCLVRSRCCLPACDPSASAGSYAAVSALLRAGAAPSPCAPPPGSAAQALCALLRPDGAADALAGTCSASVRPLGSAAVSGTMASSPGSVR